MPQLHHEISIDASPEAAWGVLGDLTATTAWIPGIVSARLEGNKRLCLTAEGQEIREEIRDYSPEKRSYRYIQHQVPCLLKAHAARWRCTSKMATRCLPGMRSLKCSIPIRRHR